MKFNTAPAITMLDGTPVKDQGDESKTLTVGSTAINALLIDDGKCTPEQKLERFSLAQRLHQAKANGGMVTLKAEEVVVIKAAVGKVYGPLIVGQVWQMLEGKE